jgi:hypothetical protein
MSDSQTPSVGEKKLKSMWIILGALGGCAVMTTGVFAYQWFGSDHQAENPPNGPIGTDNSIKAPSTNVPGDAPNGPFDAENDGSTDVPPPTIPVAAAPATTPAVPIHRNEDVVTADTPADDDDEPEVQELDGLVANNDESLIERIRRFREFDELPVEDRRGVELALTRIERMQMKEEVTEKEIWQSEAVIKRVIEREIDMKFRDELIDVQLCLDWYKWRSIFTESSRWFMRTEDFIKNLQNAFWRFADIRNLIIYEPATDFNQEESLQVLDTLIQFYDTDIYTLARLKRLKAALEAHPA